MPTCVCIIRDEHGCKSVSYKLNKEVGRGEKMSRKGDNSTGVTCRKGDGRAQGVGWGRNVDESMGRRIQLYLKSKRHCVCSLHPLVKK